MRIYILEVKHADCEGHPDIAWCYKPSDQEIEEALHERMILGKWEEFAFRQWRDNNGNFMVFYSMECREPQE